MGVNLSRCVDLICPICGKRFHHTLAWLSKHASIRCAGCKSTFEIRLQDSEIGDSEPPPEAAPHSFFTKIAGVTFENKDGTFRQDVLAKCRIGEELSLVREPDNPVDRNAIRIMRCNGEQLGYVPAHVCMTDLAAELDKGIKVRCRISDLTGGTGLNRGANIEIGAWEDETPPPQSKLPNRSSPESPMLMFFLIAAAVLAFCWVVAH